MRGVYVAWNGFEFFGMVSNPVGRVVFHEEELSMSW